VDARYGIITMAGVSTAVVEMAAASGLAVVRRDQLEPCRASTVGTGELLRHALDQGARRLLVGIGGSATNDGGAGMASALGVRFLDDKGDELPPGGAALARLTEVDRSALDRRLDEVEVVVASDVDNPLLGDQGASAVYGPQKGATPAMVAELDGALSHYADVVEDDLGRRLRDEPGAGAAGGLGFGLMAFCDAELRPGVELALDSLDADRVLEGASLVLTGEGMVDSQTLAGKLAVGVARRARRYGVPVVAVGGAIAAMERSLLDRFHEEGIIAVCSSVEGPATEDELMEPDSTRKRLERTAERIARLVELGTRLASG
jgi:glycerate kinase